MDGGRYSGASVDGLPRPRDGIVDLLTVSSRTVAGALVRIVPLVLIDCVVASTSLTVLTFVLVVRVAGALVRGSSGTFCSLLGARVRAAPRVGVARVKGDVRSGAVVVTFVFTVFFGPSMSLPSQIGASQPLRQISMSHFKKT